MPANTGGGGNSGAAGTLNIKKGNSFFKLNGATSGGKAELKEEREIGERKVEEEEEEGKRRIKSG